MSLCERHSALRIKAETKREKHLKTALLRLDLDYYDLRNEYNKILLLREQDQEVIQKLLKENQNLKNCD